MTVLADLVRNVGGELVEVTSLVPPGVDVHSFQTTPSHSLAVGDAKLIISNGFGLDDFLAPVLASAKQASTVHVVAAEGLAVQPLEEMHLSEEEEEEHDHGHEEEDLADSVAEIIHEVEDGAISAQQALEEIEALLGGPEHLAEEGSHEEEELVESVTELIHQVEEGALAAEEALEQIEGLAESHPDIHLGQEIDELIHQAEETQTSPAEILEELQHLLLSEQEGAEYDHHDHEKEGLEASLLELVHEVEEGHLTPDAAMEEMEALLEQTGMEVHDEHGHGHEVEHGHDHSAGDPHFWQDPIQTIHYVIRIRDGLVRADPANAQVYNTNAEEYIQELRGLDQEIAQTLEVVPPERRHLVTFHDAFGYFGRRYGWKVSAFVPSDASDVTPAAVVQVMERVRTEGIPAVFAEPQFSADVLEQAAADTGVQVGTIYSDAIDDEVTSYVEMMRFNARSLAENLR